MEQELKFEDALKQGCLDYGAGYTGDARMYKAFEQGMQAVVKALQCADRNGLTRALHTMGGEALAVAADVAYNELKNSGGLNAMEAARTAREERKWGEA